jgi:hypothetical protein
MYSTCLFCKNSLGSNDAIEHFPIGRRLAFDAAKGRLWVVCRKCERWNLTPVEERWEAIEECERSYRATRLRVSTEEIGLARISEGTELVRIGKPLRPEFAAWRYGDQFGARRRKTMIQTGAALLGAAAYPVTGPLLGISLGAVGWNALQATNLVVGIYRGRKIVARIQLKNRQSLLVRRQDVKETTMLPALAGEPWGLTVKHTSTLVSVPWWRYRPDTDMSAVRGDDAMRAAAQLLPHVNSKGASATVVKDAVDIATRHDDPSVSFESAAVIGAKLNSWNELDSVGKLTKLPTSIRLALEMISHEDAERRALNGELQLLEEAWRDAEEIAGISDNLFLPSGLSNELEELKRSARTPGSPVDR